MKYFQSESKLQALFEEVVAKGTIKEKDMKIHYTMIVNDFKKHLKNEANQPPRPKSTLSFKPIHGIEQMVDYIFQQITPKTSQTQTQQETSVDIVDKYINQSVKGYANLGEIFKHDHGQSPHRHNDCKKQTSDNNICGLGMTLMPSVFHLAYKKDYEQLREALSIPKSADVPCATEEADAYVKFVEVCYKKFIA